MLVKTTENLTSRLFSPVKEKKYSSLTDNLHLHIMYMCECVSVYVWMYLNYLFEGHIFAVHIMVAERCVYNITFPLFPIQVVLRKCWPVYFPPRCLTNKFTYINEIPREILKSWLDRQLPLQDRNEPTSLCLMQNATENEYGVAASWTRYLHTSEVSLSKVLVNHTWRYMRHTVFHCIPRITYQICTLF